jgi:hypothetical protein
MLKQAPQYLSSKIHNNIVNRLSKNKNRSHFSNNRILNFNFFATLKLLFSFISHYFRIKQDKRNASKRKYALICTQYTVGTYIHTIETTHLSNETTITTNPTFIGFCTILFRRRPCSTHGSRARHCFGFQRTNR